MTKPIRCPWVGNLPIYLDYHDNEWGKPQFDNQKLFEKLCLEGQQAGLSWITVLKKREAYRQAFHHFEPERVAKMTVLDLDRCMQNEGLIRHRAKLEAIVKNAKAYLAMEKCGENFVCFSLHSADGDQGFPGNVDVTVTYTLTEENSVIIEYAGKSDQDTALNLTNHAYFNLENAEQGTDVRHHRLRLNADFYLPVDREGIPNSPLKHVVGTSFDFRVAKPIQQDFLQGEQLATKGYDHSFIVNKAWQKPCVLLSSPNDDLHLEVLTSQAALQVYTGNYLGGTPTRHGTQYADYSGVALETQCLPDTPNHPEWQNYGGIVKAGEEYYQWTEYRFKEPSK